MAEPYYITTAISYPNGRPHIGHAYEAIATDAIARFQRMMGRDVFFLTGTDEHGLKMAQAARDRGVAPAELAAEMSSYFREMDDVLNISYDRFIRTTEPDHHLASQALWRAMAANGDIYPGRYEGWYSVRDEAFYDEKELVDGEGGQRLSPQGTPVEWTVEESWFFRLSAYQQKLLDHYNANPGFIQPESRCNEVMRFVEGGLSDLSISRTSFDWGVKVPDADGHVMYVWVDALTNYLTATGYPNEGYEQRWPADLHVIGKDIVRFHAVYWPAFLMSAGIALPKAVFGHGFLLHRGEKMSKSVGNVVDPIELAERFGVDQLRYFLLREVSFGQDGSWSEEAIVARSNAELSNSFGNLAQRVLSFIAKNCEGRIPTVQDGKLTEVDTEFLASVEAHLGQFLVEFELLNLERAIQSWMQAVFVANAYVDEQAPWTLRKTDPVRMAEVLSVLCLAIHHIARAIQPVIPNSANIILDQLGVPANDRHFTLNDNGLWHILNASWAATLGLEGAKLPPPAPVFPRLDLVVA